MRLAADPTIRRQVLAASRKLLAQDPAVPLGLIARAAGVSRATFYRHFGSRRALMAVVDHEPRPTARARILDAAQEMLVCTSLAELSMDELARAAGVSRGTLYRLIPGKPALLRAMIEAYSPFEAVLAILAEHGDEPPDAVLPLIARTVVGVAERRLGLLRAAFHEATVGSPSSLDAVRPVFERALGALGGYMAAQMAAHRLRPMPPLLALQAFIGPIYFHLMTQRVAQVVGLQLTPAEAVDELVAAILAGLLADP